MQYIECDVGVVDVALLLRTKARRLDTHIHITMIIILAIHFSITFAFHKAYRACIE